jgi:rifampicin phosphotransferase
MTTPTRRLHVPTSARQHVARDTVTPLADAVDAARFGGKAANLARLIAAGIPVPFGVALQHAELDVEDVSDVLAETPVIVRSSAIGEDSEDASFAGQLDSVANVTTVSDLQAAIARVWESQRSERVLAYQRLRQTQLAGMGIIIQRQIDAAISGVLFTVSPLDPQEMLVEYCPGLGEALVQGEVDPGRIAISRIDRGARVLAAGEAPLDALHVATLAQLGSRIEALFGSPQDIEWTIDTAGEVWIVQSRPITVTATRDPRIATREPRTASCGERQTWSNANVSENFPDPISPLLYSIARVGYYHYFRNLGRAFGISARRLQAMDAPLRQIIGVHGARMYYNLTSIHAVLRSAPFGDQLAASFNQFVGSEDTQTRAIGPGYRLRRIAEVVRIAAKTTWQYLFVSRRVAAFERTADIYAEATRPEFLSTKSTRGLVDDFRGFLDIRYHRWTNASLADAAAMVCYAALQRVLARAFPGRDQQALHNSLLKALPDLVSGTPALELWDLSRMVRNDRDLRLLVENEPAASVVEHVRTNPQFCAFRAAFDAFVESWGFRCSAELMLTSPNFQDEPWRVIEILAAYAAIDGESPSDLLERQAAERVRDTRAVLSTLARRSLVQWFVVRILLRWTQRSIQLRERARLKQALLYSRLRRVALALGEGLVQTGSLVRSEDIFLLTADEVDLLASGGEMFPRHVRSLIDLRRLAHAEVSASTPPDRIDLAYGAYFSEVDASEGAHYRCSDVDVPEGARDTCDAHRGGCREALQARPANQRHVYTGVAACGGTSTARAAILQGVGEAHKLSAGDILVTRQTDPGWAPIFPLVSGLVIERGGMLSHGAIIAREFGIPSVVGVKDATRVIEHGSTITVDGNRGTVRLAGAGA